MLRVNVGLSRKLSKDYNSTGYSVNVDGEVSASVSDPEGVIEQVKELFDLAEEALAQQMDRAHGDAAIASRDAEGRQPENRHDNDRGQTSRSNGNQQRSPSTNGNGVGRENGQSDEPPATNKQINYLLNIGKRQRLTTAQLERKVAEILGRQVGLYDLSKQAAAIAIDALTNGAGNERSNARN